MSARTGAAVISEAKKAAAATKRREGRPAFRARSVRGRRGFGFIITCSSSNVRASRGWGSRPRPGRSVEQAEAEQVRRVIERLGDRPTGGAGQGQRAPDDRQ